MGIFSNIRNWIQRLKEKPLFNFILNKYAIAVLIFILVICFFDTNNIGVWIKTEKLIKEQEKQIEIRTNDIDRLQLRINQLKNDQDSLEKFAREEFYFHNEGEDVYLIDEE